MDGSYDIIFDGKSVGRLKVHSQGLMTVFHGETTRLEGVCRLAVVSEGRAVQIGVLSPFDKGLRIKKSFTKHSLSELGITEIESAAVLNGTEEETPRWLREGEPESLFESPELKNVCRGVKGVLSKRTGGVVEAAFPIGSGIPFSLMPAFRLGRPEIINEKRYLVFKIKDGIPTA